MCSNAINKQLKSLSEVDSVSIDLNTNTFVVHLKNGTNVSPRTLKERVENRMALMSVVGTELDDNMTPEFQKMVEETQNFKILHHSLIFYADCQRENCENRGKNLTVHTTRSYND